MEEMISYAHKDDPKGARFCQYKKDNLPQWAVDIQPYTPPDTELPGMWENADFMGGETDAYEYDNSCACEFDQETHECVMQCLYHKRISDRLEALQVKNQRLRRAMTGWSGYGWHDGIYYDDLQEYFDGILEWKENEPHG